MRGARRVWQPGVLVRPSDCLNRQYIFAPLKKQNVQNTREPNPLLRLGLYPRTERRWMSSSYGRDNVGHLKQILTVSEEVSHAISTNKPVVALESTIYTHGDLGNDLGLEDIVRQNGAVPAVVGILDGVPTVGLTPDEVDRMVNDGSAVKVSRRDFPYLVGMGMMGRKMHGGTTIAGTMILARLAGIRVFGTGGLGGVHRGGQDSLDISADLTELGRTRVAVVSSGCKGFLDIVRTLEFLETQGVPVSTFADGRRRSGPVDFPSFWARDSGTKSPSVVSDEKEAAAMILAQELLGIETGLLFANPISEEFAIPGAEMASAIELAVREAADKGYTGSSNTPYVLKRLTELTGGRSVLANKALVRANVARAAKISTELSLLIQEKSLGKAGTSVPVSSATGSKPQKMDKSDQPASASKADILIAGSVAVDLSCDYAPPSKSTGVAKLQLHTSNPGHISQSVGGVGHNVALAAHLVSTQTAVRLCSLVGDDDAGRYVMSSLKAKGLDTTYVRQLAREYHSANRTAQYVAINEADKSLLIATADMGIFTHHSFPDYWKSAVSGTRPRWVVVDGNWSERDIRAWVGAGRESGARMAFEPVSTAKATRLFSPAVSSSSSSSSKDGHHLHLDVFPNHGIDLATPNHLELRAMFDAARETGYMESPGWFPIIDALGIRDGKSRFAALTSPEIADGGVPLQSVQLLPYIPTMLAKLGPDGVLLTTILGRDDPRLRDPAEERYILGRCPIDDHPHIGGVYMRMFPAAERVGLENVVSVNGVGDTFLGVLVAGLSMGGKVENLIDVAQKAAVLTLKSHESVSPDLGRLEGQLAEAVSA